MDIQRKKMLIWFSLLKPTVPLLSSLPNGYIRRMRCCLPNATFDATSQILDDFFTYPLLVANARIRKMSPPSEEDLIVPLRAYGLQPLTKRGKQNSMFQESQLRLKQGRMDASNTVLQVVATMPQMSATS